MDDKPMEPARMGRTMVGDPDPSRFLTYGDLKKASQDWPEGQLHQFVQIAPPAMEDGMPLILMPVHAAMTVGDMLNDSEGHRARASIRFPDGADKDGQLVLFTDWNPAAITSAVSAGVFEADDDPGGGYPTDDLLEMVEGGLGARGRSLYNIARRQAGYGVVVYDPAWEADPSNPDNKNGTRHPMGEEWRRGLRVSAYHPTLRGALAAELRALATEADDQLKRGGGMPVRPKPPLEPPEEDFALVVIDPEE